MAAETNLAGLVIPDGPYVYTLADADGVFYIGKGRGRRMFHHAKEALRGKPGRSVTGFVKQWEEASNLSIPLLESSATIARLANSRERLSLLMIG